MPNPVTSLAASLQALKRRSAGAPAICFIAAMTRRRRKFLGMIAVILFLTAYCLIAMAIGGRYVVGTHSLLEAAYFILAGLAWLPPVMILVRWMSKPDAG